MATVVIILWTVVTSFTILKLIDITVGLRVSLEHELYGADFCEHMIPLPMKLKIHADKIIGKIKEEHNDLNDTCRLKNKIKRVLCCGKKEEMKYDRPEDGNQNETIEDTVNCTPQCDSGIVDDDPDQIEEVGVNNPGYEF